MKKLLFLLISIPLIFSSCEKEEENPSNNNNNNNSSLVIHNTSWEVTSFEQNYNTIPYQTINIPCTNCEDISPDYGILNIRYTFEQSNLTTLYVRIVYDNNEVKYDTLSYEYIPQNNVISVDCLTSTGESEGFIEDELVFNIIGHTSNDLSLEQNDNSGNITGYTKTHLTKTN
tara:strand:+ start:108 stop:626 length:519 start_codon:yes stop_codon:yes gene_type:complete